MVRGLYTAYTGMVNEQKRLDVISNNMANAATVGYKTERVSNQAFNQELTLKIKDTSVAYHQQPIGHMSLGVKVGEVYTDYSQGSLRETEATFDLALEGSGFFQISYHNRSAWARGGNLLGMTIQRSLLYAEKGPYFTLGICLNL